ncbi:hypothetical protein F5Y17DRAFT_444906 [Xylariaceae sp. FL0594]|nr:hypothetical protein F5Y17DRAFT_444906 [Xylariaceae sp. FL0594]
MKGRWSPFVLLAVWGALGGLGHAWELRSRAGGNGGNGNYSDVPSPQDFIRRGCHTVAVIGDYLYLDGGRVTVAVNGSEPADSPAFDVNTWSIDLTDNWTNETVKIRSIPKAAPSLAKQVHWVDSSTGSLYTWGGFAAQDPPPSHDLWRFTADGSGGGAWSLVTQRDYVTFSKLKNIFGAAFTQTNDAGFALGGAVTHLSDHTVSDDIPGYATPGLVSYDFRTGSWDNSSSAAYGGYGTSLNARAEYVPFGPNGLIVFLGGAETPVDATNETIVEVNWNTVTLVDPVTMKWYKQSTTGQKPPTIESHCSVGVPGPNGTYEIYIFGGVSDQIRSTSSDVTVLSLPGFVFFQGPSNAPRRSDHQCAVIGKGGRQMISVGGAEGENRTFTAPTTADPWTYGIGIFDMTELEWRDSYDPDAASYDSPKMVKDWYEAGHLQSMRWDNDELRQLMTNQSSAEPAPAINQTQEKSGSTAAIAGGAVGGIAGVAALGAVSFFLMRRRRSRVMTPDSARRVVVDNEERAGVPEYKPEPWPKDHPRHYSHSPDSIISAGPKSPAFSSQFAPEVDGTWRSGLSGHQDGMVPMHGAHGISELADPNLQWAYELPAPLEGPRSELPDRNYPH